jgi:hypothetical protein
MNVRNGSFVLGNDKAPKADRLQTKLMSDVTNPWSARKVGVIDLLRKGGLPGTGGFLCFLSEGLNLRIMPPDNF